MVGSGFSLNAEPAAVAVAGGSMPTWSVLTGKILDAQYPLGDAERTGHRETAEGEMGSTGGFLRLAEEYVTLPSISF